MYFVDDKGRAAECFKADGAVKFLLYSEGKDVLVVVTEGLILSQHRVAHDSTTTEVAKVDRKWLFIYDDVDKQSDVVV